MADVEQQDAGQQQMATEIAKERDVAFYAAALPVSNQQPSPTFAIRTSTRRFFTDF